MSNQRKIFSRRCWVEETLQPACIIIENDIIVGLEERLSVNAHDYGDAIVMPGVIDAHVHLNEPGRTEWEGFESGTRAAAAGGVTTVVDMPLNSAPVTTSVRALKEKMNSSIGKLNVNVGFYGGFVPGNESELGLLAEAGVLGVKCFLTHSGIDDFPNVETESLYHALQILSVYSIPLLVHCELSKKTAGNIHFSHYRDYLDSRPDEWETSAVREVLNAASITGSKAHIVHVSSTQSLPLIKDAKAAGVNISAETCPHYIFFNAENIPDNQTIYKCAPPIRSKENNLGLIGGLKTGVLDFIASDHSPAPPDLKKIEAGDLAKAWGGIAGLQFLLTASFTAVKDVLSIEEFIPLLTSRPSAFLLLNEKKGYLNCGYDADLTIWDPSVKHVVNEKEIYHRHAASPYVGKELWGKIHETIVNGETVFVNDQFKKLNTGKWVLRM